jgi:hypothetical protein
MAEETVVYCESLRKLAQNKEMFQLDLTALRFAIDIIWKIML